MQQRPEPCRQCQEEGLGLEIPGWYDGLCIIHHRREKLERQRAVSFWARFRPGGMPAADSGFWRRFTKGGNGR